MGIGRPRDLEKQRFWGPQLRAWQESGLIQREFCRRQGFGINTFTTWKASAWAAGAGTGAGPRDGRLQSRGLGRGDRSSFSASIS
jgi:hypothetical protein